MSLFPSPIEPSPSLHFTPSYKVYPIMLSLKLLILISFFQYGQTVTLTLSELEDWKNQMRAELKLEIKTEIFQEINTQLGNVAKTSQEIITVVQDHGVQLGNLQEFTQEVHNNTIQIKNLGDELQETNVMVGNQSTELINLKEVLIHFKIILIAAGTISGPVSVNIRFEVQTCNQQ